MEDIDDLLDEVEAKYVKKKTPAAGSDTKALPCISNSKKPTNSKSSAIEKDINDILDLNVDEDIQKKASASRSSSKSSVIKSESRHDQVRRCLPVFLGGSNDDLGVGSTVHQRACDQLRCTSCDFRVSHFENMAWKKDTDYLFLRNNVPEFEKLKAKLIKKKGWRAYCCQCSWRNILELIEISDPSLKWVCGKHSS